MASLAGEHRAGCHGGIAPHRRSYDLRMSRVSTPHRWTIGAVLQGFVVEAVRRAPRDLSLTWTGTLATLHRTGPRRITDLALAQGVTQPSMTNLVRAMEREGYVERNGDPRDGRVVLVSLTAVGEELVRRRTQRAVERFADLVELLPAEEIATLEAAMPALVHLHELAHGDDDETSGAGQGRRTA